MTAKEELQVAEMLASRLCHDLVGPITAIGNGLELLEEGEAALDAEARQLVAESAGEAATLLQYYRLAYGAAGNQMSDFALLRRLSEELSAVERSELVWPESLPPILPSGLAKLILNMLALAFEALPRGGCVVLSLSLEAEICRVMVTASGRDADLREEVASQLASPRPEALSPRSVHAFFTRQVAERLGGELRAERRPPGELALEARVPA